MVTWGTSRVRAFFLQSILLGCMCSPLTYQCRTIYTMVSVEQIFCDIDIYSMLSVCRTVIQGTNLVIMMVKTQYTCVSVRLSVKLSGCLASSLSVSVSFSLSLCRPITLSRYVSSLFIMVSFQFIPFSLISFIYLQ